MSSPIQSTSPRRQRIAGLLIAFVLLALAIRIGLLLALTQLTHGREFGDDTTYYRSFLQHPTLLITGHGAADNPEMFRQMSVYSPLIPLQYAYPGRWLVHAFGEFKGFRLTMIFYDMLALAMTGYVLLTQEQMPRHRLALVALLMLTFVPGSIGASAVFAQEDTIAAFWVAIAALLLQRGHPTVAAMVGAMGLFTHKLFGGLISMGMWIGGKGARLRIVAGTLIVAAAFAVFTLVRARYSGVLLTSYSYDAVYNSPSPWALLNQVAWINFPGFKIVVVSATLIVLAAATRYLMARRVYFTEATVAIHAAFFAIFVGIQPEHHQWFMPFLMIMIYHAAQHRDWMTFLIGWSYSGVAYTFKLLYGLQARPSVSTAGKDAFRQYLFDTLAPHLHTLQLSFNVLAIVWAVLVFWRAVKMSQTRFEPLPGQPLIP